MTHFETSLQLFLAELARLDLYIQSQVWRARQQHDAEENGLPAFYIPETEVDTLLAKAVGAPTWTTVPLPDEQQTRIQNQLDQMAAATAQRTAASLEAGIYLRLVALAHLFDLTHFDLDVILICLAPELDRRYERLYAYLHDDVTRRHPTVDLILNLLGADLETKVALRTRFNASAPLMQHQLVTLAAPPNQQCPALLSKDVQLDPRVVQFLLEHDEVDSRLRGVVTITSETMSLDQLCFPDSFHQRLARLGAQITSHQKSLIIYCQGGYGLGKESTAAALCQPLHLGLLVVNGQHLAQQTLAEFEKLTRLIDREARLVGAALYWAGFDALLPDEKKPYLDKLLAMLDTHPGPTFLAGDTAWEPADALPNVDFQRVVFPQPGFAERRKVWESALGTPPQPSPLEGEEEEVVFETTQTLVVTRGQLQSAFTFNPKSDRYTDRLAHMTGKIDQSFAVFADVDANDTTTDDEPAAHQLLLAFDQLADAAGQTAVIDLHMPEPKRWQNAAISWDYWDGAAWHALEVSDPQDEQDMVTITLPNLPEIVPHIVNGVAASWLRARLDAAALLASDPNWRPPQISHITLTLQAGSTGNTPGSTSGESGHPPRNGLC